MISMGLSYFLERQLLNAVLLGYRYQGPGTLFLALFHTNPGKDASGEEVSKESYARRMVVFDTAAPAGVYRNSAEVNFPEAKEDWGLVAHAAIFDAPKGGNLLAFGPLDDVADIMAGEIPTFAAGSIEVLWNPVTE